MSNIKRILSFACYIIHIMNIYENVDKGIFISVKYGMYSIKQGKNKLNRIFHLSRNENICTTQMNETHSLFVLYNIKNIFLSLTMLN